MAYQLKYETKGRTRLSDYRMRSKVLPDLTDKAENSEAQSLEKHSNWTMSLDGWTDVSGNSIVAVMLVDGDKNHYIGNLDLDYVRHTAENIKAELIKLMGDKMNIAKAVVTDNPRVMLKLRNELCSGSSHLISLNCVLHGLNLVCKDTLKTNEVEPWVGDITRLVTFFSNSSIWRKKLDNWGQTNKVTRFLEKYVEVRWYSFVSMVLSVQRYENGFKYCAGLNEEGVKLPEDVVLIINSTIFKHANFLCQILKPIADSIAFLERDKCRLCDVWTELLRIYQYYKQNQGNFPVRYINTLKVVMQSLNQRASLFTDDIYLLSLYLSPSYRRICTSRKFSAKEIHKKALTVAMKWNHNMSLVEAKRFKGDIRAYESNLPPHHSREKDPISYWTAFGDSVLGRFALSVLTLVPSSASVERLFSRLARTKTIYRNRMKPENLASHGKIKLEALNWSFEKDIKDVSAPEYVFEFIDDEDDDNEYDDNMNEDLIDVYFDSGMGIFYEQEECHSNENEVVLSSWENNDQFWDSE